MSQSIDNIPEEVDIILPKQGLLYKEETLDFILCKPKLMPLKSVTLEKLEKMQKDAEQKLKDTEITTNGYNEDK